VLRRLATGRCDRRHARASSYGSALGLAAAVALAWACGGGSGHGSSGDDDDNATGGKDGTGGKGSTESGGSGTGGSGTAATGGDSSDLLVNSSEQLVGDFTITVKASSDTVAGSTSFSGRVRNAPLLAADGYVWTLLDKSGKCELTQPQAPFCDPTCASGSKCVGTNKCVETPVEQDVGAVTVVGLKLSANDATEFAVNVQSENKKLYQKTGIAYPACAAGDTLSLSAEGKTYEAFSMETTCIDPLEMTVGETVPLRKGETTTLTWTPPAKSDASKILIEVDISHHGGQTGQINCEVDDNGSFDLPEELTTRLIELGYAGFPDISVTRVASGSADIEPGRVDFVMTSSVVLYNIDLGVTSCTGDDTEDDPECGAGQKCNTALGLCEVDCSDDDDACPEGTECNPDTKLCDQVRSR
jgi:hypothetical protein